MTAPLFHVGEIADQLRGVSYGKTEALADEEVGYLPVLRAGNITDSGLVFDDLVFVPAERVTSKQRIRKGDVVIAASSGSLEVVGKAAMAKSDFDGGFGAFCKVLRPNPAKVEPAYFAHYFQTREYRQKVSSLAAGANINNLRNEHLDDLLIPLPPLPEQCRIAAILDQADALRAKRREALAQLDELQKAIFIEMFGDPQKHIDTGNTEELANVVAPGRIVTYGIVQAGPEVEDGVPYIRTGDIKNGVILEHQLARTSKEIADSYSRSAIATGDIVMSIRATVGTTALVPSTLDGANLTQGTARISPGTSARNLYLLNYLRTNPVQRWIQSHVKGATFREITLGKLRQLPVFIPPLELQDSFVEKIRCTEKLAARASESLEELNGLFFSLQHRAFRGEL